MIRGLAAALVIALFAFACGGERETTWPVDIQPRAVVEVTGTDLRITRGALTAEIARDDPRLLRLTSGTRAIEVRRLATGTASAAVDEDLVTVRASGALEAYIFATDRGVEELVVADDDVRYRVELPAGLRLRVAKARRDVVEVVDWRGAPQFRMLAPRAWEADGSAHRLTVSVDGAEIQIDVPDVGGPLLVDPEWQIGGQSAFAHWCAAPVVLNDGRVLVTDSPTSVFGGEPTEGEIYDPISATFTSVGEIPIACGHTATLLPDGRVLLVSDDVWLFEPETNETDPVEGAARPARALHTATRLADGRVLIAGGFDPQTLESLTEPEALDSVQIFDPTTNLLEDAEPLPLPLGHHRATLLAGGAVMVSGGQTDAGAVSAALWRFNPSFETWTAWGSLAAARHGHTAVLLPQRGAAGQVLIAGGYLEGVWFEPDDLDPELEPTASSEIVDLASMQVSAAPPLAHPPRGAMITMMLPSGDPLLVGGGGSQADPDWPWLHGPWAERFDTALDAFVPAALPAPWPVAGLGATVLPSGDPWVIVGQSGTEAWARSAHHFPHAAPARIDLPFFIPGPEVEASVTPLSTAQVLVVVGGYDNGAPGRAWVFDPVTRTTTPVPGFDDVRGYHATAALANGRVLVVDANYPARAAFVFDPANGTLTRVGDPTVQRGPEMRPVSLPDGSVLLIGGSPTGAVEHYDPVGPFSLLDIEIIASAAVLAVDGRVWCFGGCDFSGFDPPPCPIQIFDWRDGSLEILDGTDAPFDAVATTLVDGRIAVTSRNGNYPSLMLVDPVAKQVTPTGLPHSAYEMVLLPTGRALLAGDSLSILSVVGDDVQVENAGLGFVLPVPGARKMTLMPDGGVFVAHIGGNAEPEIHFSLWYESAPPAPEWRPQLAPPPSDPAWGSTVELTGENLLGLLEPTDHPSAGKINHPVAVFMPFSGAPTIGGFHDWSANRTGYTPPIPMHAGPGYLFASVAGQHGGTYARLLPSDHGAPCATATGCASGICANGVCCDRLCAGCEACAAALKADGPDGICGPVQAGIDPHDACEPDDVLTCAHNGECDGAGECALYPNGTVCDEGRVCIDEGCLEGCFSNAHCANDEICGPAGSCIPHPGNSEAIGCAPCATGPQRDDAAGWWLLAAAASLYRRRRRC